MGQLASNAQQYVATAHPLFRYTTKAELEQFPPAIRSALNNAAAVCWNHSRVHFLEGKSYDKRTVQHELTHMIYDHIPHAECKDAAEKTIADGERMLKLFAQKNHPSEEESGLTAFDWKQLKHSFVNMPKRKAGDPQFGMELDMMLPDYRLQKVASYLKLPVQDDQYCVLACHLAAARRNGNMDKIKDSYQMEEPCAYRASVDDAFANRIFKYAAYKPAGADAGVRPYLNKRYSNNWYFRDKNNRDIDDVRGLAMVAKTWDDAVAKANAENERRVNAVKASLGDAYHDTSGDQMNTTVDDGREVHGNLSLDFPLELGEQTSLEVPLELGDVSGHVFHGNQWTGGAGVGLHRLDQPWPGPGKHPAFANVNARQVIRWCGKQGMDAQACKAALDRAGMPTPLPTIRAELPIGARGMGRKGEQAPIYVFSPEQKAVLRGAVLKTAEGLTEAQIARGEAWQAKIGQQAQARNAAAAAVPPAIAAGVNAVNRIQARQPTPANVTPTGQEGYATKKALADQAEADVRAIRQRIQGGDRSQAVYRDRALAGAAAANFHRGAAIAANAEGKNDEMIRHMQKAQYHDARVQHYNGKIIRGDLKVDAGTSDVLNRMNAVRNRAGVPGQASIPASAPPAAPVAHQSLPAQPPKDAEEIAKVEKNLSDAPIADLKKVGGPHVSECYRAYDSGGKLVGYYKPSRGEHVGAQFLAHGYPAKQSYKREQAAWEVAKAVGMSDLVPASVQRNHPVHGAGVIIAPVAGQSADEKYGIPNWMGGKDLDPKAFDGVKDQQRAAVFDYVIQNVDRHQGNWMCKPPDDRIGLIDHGYCLAKKDNNFAYKANNAFYNNIPHGDRIPSEIKDAWKDKWPQIEAGLKKCGIEPEAIQHAKHRYDKLMAASTFRDMVK